MKPRCDPKPIVPVLLLVLLLAAPSILRAADAPLWSRTYDGTGHYQDEANGVALFGDFVYAVGTQKNPATDDDAVAYCHRKDGSLVWSYRFGGPPGYDLFYRVVVDASGFPYVLGVTTTDIVNDNTLIKLFKFNPGDNTVVWVRDLLPAGYVSSISERFVYLDNALVLTGNVRKPNGDEDLYVASVSTGNVLNWEKALDVSGGGRDFGRAIAAGTGAVFVAGETGGTSNFYVARFRSSDGVQEWFNTVATNGTDTAGQISVAGDNVFVSAAVVDGGEITPTLFRFSAANGSETWRRHVAVSPGSIKNYAGAVLSANGTVLFAGTLDRSGQDTFLNAYADNGDLLWAKDLGVTGRDDLPSSIFFDGSRWILLGMFPPDPLTEAAAGFKTFAPDGTLLETVLFPKTGTGPDSVIGGAIDNSGNIYIAGRVPVGTDKGDFFLGKAGPPLNTPPVISSGPSASPGTITDAQTSNLSVAASDADGDVLVYSWSATGGSVSGSGAAAVYIPPRVTSTTVYRVDVTVSDGNGGSASGSVNVTVDPALPPDSRGGGGGCLVIDAPGRDSSTPWQAGILLLPGFLLLARRVVRKLGCNIRRFEL